MKGTAREEFKDVSIMTVAQDVQVHEINITNSTSNTGRPVANSGAADIPALNLAGNLKIIIP